jgi:hypothetical protein
MRPKKPQTMGALCSCQAIQASPSAIASAAHPTRPPHPRIAPAKAALRGYDRGVKT